MSFDLADIHRKKLRESAALIQEREQLLSQAWKLMDASLKNEVADNPYHPTWVAINQWLKENEQFRPK